jgi:hypothetical protein
MSDPNHILAVARQYAAHIEQALADQPDFSASTEAGAAVQIERGLMLPQVLLNREVPREWVERLIELGASALLPEVIVLDRLGHQRPVYRPLLVYAWLLTYKIQFERLSRMDFGRWDEALRAWCDVLADGLSQTQLPKEGIPAAAGAVASTAAWTALALHIAGKLFIRDPWTDLAAGVMGQLSRAQQPSGAFLIPSASDSPEMVWYHELCTLHALGSYAVQAEDRTVAASVERATNYHLIETQPDHATSQPWALFSFIWNPPTRPIADQLLHAVTLQQPTPDPVSLILLADSLYCLRLFL